MAENRSAARASIISGERSLPCFNSTLISVSQACIPERYTMSTCSDAPAFDTRFLLVASDLDGTLLNAAHEVSSETRKTFQRLTKARPNVKVALCSGRSTASMAHIVQSLQLDVPTAIVCFNGSAGGFFDFPCGEAAQDPPLITTRLDPVFFCQTLSRAIILKALSIVRESSAFTGAVQLYTPSGTIYTNARTAEMKKHTARYEHLTTTKQIFLEVENDEEFLDRLESIETDGMCKMLAFCEEADLEASYLDMERSFKALESEEGIEVPTFVRGSPPFFCEILPPGSNKGEGLRRLCESLGIPLEKVLAFGDGDNDQEFLALAGHGVAMKNAGQRAQASARSVCFFTNEEEGVAKTIEYLFARGNFDDY